jgi:hypothetical protein
VRHLSYANVVSSIALFLVLTGGAAYAPRQGRRLLAPFVKRSVGGGLIG